MGYETKINFVVTGVEESQLSTIKKEIESSNIWKAGDLISANAILKHKECGFNITKIVKCNEDSNEVEKLVAELYHHKQLLDVVGGSRRLICVIYFSGDERPNFSFSPDILKCLSELNASLSVSIYYLFDESTEEDS